MKSKLLFISLVSMLALLVSACSLQFTTNINADGSGEFIIEIDVTAEDIADIEDEWSDDFDDFLDDEYGDNDPEDICESLLDSLDIPRDAEFDFTERAGGFTCTLTIPFDDDNELEDLYQELGFGQVDRIRMNRDGELKYAMDVAVYFPDEDYLGVQDVEVNWIVTAPGSITDEGTSDDRSGRTLTWDLRSGRDERIEFESAAGGFNWLLVMAIGLACLCALVLLGGGAAYYFYAKKKKDAAK